MWSPAVETNYFETSEIWRTFHQWDFSEFHHRFLGFPDRTLKFMCSSQILKRCLGDLVYVTLWVSINPSSAGTDFIRQILTSKVDPRTERYV